MDNKENLNSSPAPTQNKWREKAEWRRSNRNWLDKSFEIALKIMDYLDKNNITQKELASRLNISPQQVSKILKGSENLTLETISKIECALDYKIIHINQATKQHVNTNRTSIGNINFRMIKNAGIIVNRNNNITEKIINSNKFAIANKTL